MSAAASSLAGNLPALQIVMPLLSAPACILLYDPRRVWWLAFLVSAAALGVAALLLYHVLGSGTIVYSLGGWVAPWGIEYRIDALNALLLVLVSGASAVSLVYARESVEREIPGASSMVLRNGVDLEAFRPAPEKAEAGHIVFTGVMDYLPNVDGCTWFVEEVLPRVRAKHRDARFSIVGSRPIPAVEALGRVEGVTVTGFVPETRDWLERASVSVAPLLFGSGLWRMYEQFLRF